MVLVPNAAVHSSGVVKLIEKYFVVFMANSYKACVHMISSSPALFVVRHYILNDDEASLSRL